MSPYDVWAGAVFACTIDGCPGRDTCDAAGFYPKFGAGGDASPRVVLVWESPGGWPQEQELALGGRDDLIAAEGGEARAAAHMRRVFGDPDIGLPQYLAERLGTSDDVRRWAAPFGYRWPEDIYMTEAFKCFVARAKDKERACGHCWSYLRDELALVMAPGCKIVTIGKHAYHSVWRALTGTSPTPIAVSRLALEQREWWFAPRDDLRLFPLPHPQLLGSARAQWPRLFWATKLHEALAYPSVCGCARCRAASRTLRSGRIAVERPHRAVTQSTSRGTLVNGPPDVAIPATATELARLEERGRRRLRQGLERGLLDFLPRRGSKREALLVAFAGAERPIGNAQCAALARAIYALRRGRPVEEAIQAPPRGDRLAIAHFVPRSGGQRPPNRGFIQRRGDRFVCPLW